MPAPFANMTNITTFDAWIAYTNTSTSQLYGHFLLLVLWVIVFMALGNRPMEYSMATASFITFIAAAILWGMGAVSGIGIILTVAALIGSSILLLYRR